MITAALLALGDLVSPAFRAVLWKSLALTLGLFAALWFAVYLAVANLTLVRWSWLDTTLDILAGVGLFVAMVFLIGPMTAVFAGLFLDAAAARVEALHYSADPPGRPLPTAQALLTAVQFAAVMLLVFLLATPFLLFGIGAFAMLLANAYLLGREYFEMAAMRHLPAAEAKALRKENALRIFLAGLIPAAWALVPLGNLMVPLFTTAYMVHLFKAIAPRAGAAAER